MSGPSVHCLVQSHSTYSPTKSLHQPGLFGNQRRGGRPFVNNIWLLSGVMRFFSQSYLYEYVAHIFIFLLLIFSAILGQSSLWLSFFDIPTPMRLMSFRAMSSRGNARLLALW